MKRIKNILTTLLILFSFLGGVSYAKDSNLIKEAIKKGYHEKGSIKIDSLNRAGRYSITYFSFTDKKGDVKENAALLYKRGSKWQIIDFSKGPTADFLRINKVRRRFWGRLIGRGTMKKQGSILKYLSKNNKKSKTTHCVSIRIANKWALCSYIETKSDLTGQILLEKINDKWSIVKTTKDSIDYKYLKSKAIPKDIINKLLGNR